MEEVRNVGGGAVDDVGYVVNEDGFDVLSYWGGTRAPNY